MNSGAIEGGRFMRVTLALIAVTALLIVGLSGPSASASGGNTASAAKKKCKKKKKKHGKKGRKCNKKVNPSQIVRATLVWSNGGAPGVDMDLFAFDVNGKSAGNGITAIPDSAMSPDVTGPAGTETFTAHPGTVLSFGVCYTQSESTHTDYTITYVTADGVSHTETRADDGVPPSLGGPAHVNYSGGAPIPADYCPGTNLVP
jgi:hypothetical protein